MISLEINSLSEIQKVASDFLKLNPGKKQFAFYGTMGVGKTTFIKAICNELDVIETVTSPTFAIVNEYNTRNGQKIYHFDLYRICKLDEIFDLGYEDYMYSEHYCFIEWPELGEELLPDHIVKVQLSERTDSSRTIEF